MDLRAISLEEVARGWTRRRFLAGLLGGMVLPLTGNASEILVKRPDGMHANSARNAPLLWMSPTFRGRLGHGEGLEENLSRYRSERQRLAAGFSETRFASGDGALPHETIGTVAAQPNARSAYANYLGDLDWKDESVSADSYWSDLQSKILITEKLSRIFQRLKRVTTLYRGGAMSWQHGIAGVSSFLECSGRALNEWAGKELTSDENCLVAWTYAPKQDGCPIHSDETPLLYANDGELMKAFFPPIFCHIASDILGKEDKKGIVAHSQGIVIEVDSGVSIGDIELQGVLTPSGNKVYYAKKPILSSSDVENSSFNATNLVGVANPDAPEEIAFRLLEFQPTVT